MKKKKKPVGFHQYIIGEDRLYDVVLRHNTYTQFINYGTVLHTSLTYMLFILIIFFFFLSYILLFLIQFNYSKCLRFVLNEKKMKKKKKEDEKNLCKFGKI